MELTQTQVSECFADLIIRRELMQLDIPNSTIEMVMALNIKGSAKRINRLVYELEELYHIISDENYVYFWNGLIYEQLTLIMFRKSASYLYKLMWPDYGIKKGTEIYEQLRDERYMKEFYQPDHIVVFRNGYLNLLTKELMPASEDFEFTGALPYNYTPNQRPSLFLYALQTMIPDEKDRMKVLAYMRYCLTTGLEHQTAQIWDGAGNNGKSSLQEFLADLVGDLGMSFNLGQFAKDIGYIVQLKGLNLAICSEIGNVKLTPEAQESLKSLITDKYQDGRGAYQRPMHWKNTTKFIFASNYLPRLEGHPEQGFYRRWQIIRFTQDFTGREDKTLFKDILQYEAGAVLTYLLMNDEFAEVKPDPWKEVKNYWLDCSSSTKRFLQKTCVVNTGKTRTSELYNNYVDYMCTVEPEAEIVKSSVFSIEMGRLGHPVVKDANGDRWFRKVECQLISDLFEEESILDMINGGNY